MKEVEKLRELYIAKEKMIFLKKIQIEQTIKNGLNLLKKIKKPIHGLKIHKKGKIS